MCSCWISGRKKVVYALFIVQNLLSIQCLLLDAVVHHISITYLLERGCLGSNCAIKV